MGYKRLLELEKLISIYNHAYYNLDIEVISNDSYDELQKEWKNLLTFFPDHDSTIQLKFTSSIKKGIALSEPMLAISRFNNKTKFLKLMDRYKAYTIEEKVDGVDFRLIYNKKGNFLKAHLRGSGVIGKEVTDKIGWIGGIPSTIENHSGEEIEITGVVTCRFDDFNAFCAEHELHAKTIKGAINEFLKSKINDDQAIFVASDEPFLLTFIASHANEKIRQHCKMYPLLIDWLIENGFDVPESFEKVPEVKPEALYPTEGVVIKNNHLSSWSEQPNVGFYTYIGCYRYPSTLLSSEITGVTWGTTTKGYLTAIINFKPIHLNGKTLKFCEFHSPKLYIKNGLRIKSELEISQGSNTIPKLITVTNDNEGDIVTFPEICPYCEEQLSLDNQNEYFCDNTQCIGQITSKVSRLLSVNGLDISTLNEKKIAELVANNLIEFPHDIFTLTKEDLNKVNIKGKKAAQLIDEIKLKCETKLLFNWLYGLNIPWLTEIRAIAIEEEFLNNEEDHTTESLLEILSSVDSLNALFGVDGIKIASFVLTHYRDFEILLGYFNWKKYHAQTHKFFQSTCISITGKLKYDRKILKDILNTKGYYLDNIVTKTTTYLLVGERPSPGKVALAERFDVPIVNVSGMGIENIMVFLEARKC